MAKLSVNVNKIATLRNSRGKNLPDLLQVVDDVISYGAEGITVHPRPDERHIRRQDVLDLKGRLSVELNVEGYPSKDHLDLLKSVMPDQATFVPDPPEALTSNAGWRLNGNEALLSTVAREMEDLGIRSSLFIDPLVITEEELRSFREMGFQRIELYTEAYADAFGSKNQQNVLNQYVSVARMANAVGFGTNAGHDLNLRNLPEFVRSIDRLQEVSIGHALICDALYLGLEEAVERYLEASKP